MNKKNIRATFLVNEELWEKFKQVAKHESRSNSKEVARAVRVYVENFEKEHEDVML